ncbi:MAG: hypothetical protein ACXVBL_19015, partial [Bdellovibrionota bacterium]
MLIFCAQFVTPRRFRKKITPNQIPTLFPCQVAARRAIFLHMKFLFIAPLLALTLFSSCAALTRYKCNREYAAKKGMEDADAGRLSMPSRLDGSSCEGEYSPSDFSKDYNYGFHQKIQEVCQAGSVANYGRADGEAGNVNKPQKAKLGLCADSKDAKKLDSIYEGEFRKAFCAPARASTLGAQRAQSWQEADF